MINLLPNDTKAQIRAARANVIFVRITLILVITLGLMCAGFSGAVYVTMQNKQNAENNKPQATASVEATKAAAQKFSDGLKAAKTILGSQISYTTVLIELTNSLPAHTALTSINLTNSSFGTTISIAALAGTADDAQALKAQLSQSKLFTDVRFNSLSANTDTKSAYHETVALSAKLTATPPIIAESGLGK